LAVVGVEVMSVLVGAQFLFSLDVPLLRWFSPATTGAGGSSNPPMSPLSAATFMSAGLALLCELPPWGRRWWCRQTAATLALVPWSTSLVVLLMYVAGMPLLYGGRALPMSILTAFSLALLSFSVLLAAGCDTVPLSLFRTASRETPRSYPFTADSAAKG
jgi:hypothetical protein